MIVTIFDIDGTLVESFGFDDACYISAVREVSGEVHIHLSPNPLLPTKRLYE